MQEEVEHLKIRVKKDKRKSEMASRSTSGVMIKTVRMAQVGLKELLEREKERVNGQCSEGKG